MYIRKIGVVAGFAAGASFALAPLASADPVEITSTVSGEISSMNSLFDSEAALAGDSAAIIHHAGSFDTIPLADAPQVAPLTTLDYELYGVNPLEAGPASDPGSYEVLNGALGKFDDAYNVLLYAAENGGAIDPNDADFIGSASSITHALGLATATDAAQYFFNFGLGDLEGYLGIFPSAAASAAAEPALVDPLAGTLSSEISSLNGIFESEAALAGDSTDVVTHAASFDTIPLSFAPDSGTPTPLDFELYGLNPIANAASDPGSYNVFNGALTEFYDAYNVGLGALLNGGDLIGADDLFGSASTIAAALATDSVSGAAGDFLSAGFADLTGFFTP